MNPGSSSSSSSRNGGRSRGGRRRRSGGGSNRSSGSGSHTSASTSSSAGSAKAKPNLLQRVLAIFTGGGSEKKTSKRNAASSDAARHNGYGRVAASSGGDSSAATAPSPVTRDRERDPAASTTGSNVRSARRPESVEVTTPRLYVGNLSFDTTEADLTELFNGVGRVVSAEIVTHRQTQRSKGFAFVQMSDVDEAKRAVEQLHDKEFMGRKLFLSGAKSPDPQQQDDRSEPRFAT